MKSDIELARSIELKKIKQVAESVGIPREEVENYGRYIAKIPEHLIDEEKVKQSNLILVTAITATKAGIGKTTVSIGLALGLNKIGKKAIVALREPSLGPCFGMTWTTYQRGYPGVRFRHYTCIGDYGNSLSGKGYGRPPQTHREYHTWF